MSFTSALVAIVAIIAWAYLRSTRSSRIGQQSELRDGPRFNPGLEREVIELRKRVEVLERILTDERNANRLAQDIEALREN